MDRLESMRVFAAVAETGGFSAAAHQLSMRLPTVSRKVSELEAYLGIQLLTRTTRSVSLTEAGSEYLDNVIQILSQIEKTEELILGAKVVPGGVLTVASPTLFGWKFLTPILSEFMQAYPKIEVRHEMDAQIQDYVGSRIDAGVRIGNLPDSSMKAVVVGKVKLKVFAAPAYWDRVEKPKVPQDLHQHVIASMFTVWRFGTKTGGVRRLTVSPSYKTTSVEAIKAFVLSGGGVGFLNSLVIAEELASGALVPVLKDFELPLQNVNLVFPSQENLPAKTRHFVDFAVPKLREVLAM